MDCNSLEKDEPFSIVRKQSYWNGGNEEQKFVQCIQLYSFGQEMVEASIKLLEPLFGEIRFTEYGYLDHLSLLNWKKEPQQQEQLQRIEDVLYSIEEGKGNMIMQILRANPATRKFYDRDLSDSTKRRATFTPEKIPNEVIDECLEREEWKKSYANGIKKSRSGKAPSMLLIADGEEESCDRERMTKIICDTAAYGRKACCLKANELVDKVVLLKVQHSHPISGTLFFLLCLFISFLLQHALFVQERDILWHKNPKHPHDLQPVPFNVSVTHLLPKMLLKYVNLIRFCIIIASCFRRKL